MTDNRLFGWLDANNNVIRVYDGCACYDSSASPICGDCYHIGSDRVNCSFAGQYDEGKPVKWDPKSKKWVIKTRPGD